VIHSSSEPTNNIAIGKARDTDLPVTLGYYPTNDSKESRRKGGGNPQEGGGGENRIPGRKFEGQSGFLKIMIEWRRARIEKEKKGGNRWGERCD